MNYFVLIIYLMSSLDNSSFSVSKQQNSHRFYNEFGWDAWMAGKWRSGQHFNAGVHAHLLGLYIGGRAARLCQGHAGGAKQGQEGRNRAQSSQCHEWAQKRSWLYCWFCEFQSLIPLRNHKKIQAFPNSICWNVVTFYVLINLSQRYWGDLKWQTPNWGSTIKIQQINSEC